MRLEVNNLERETGLYAAGYLINLMKEDYKEYPKVGEYLDNVLEDVINNLMISGLKGTRRVSKSPAVPKAGSIP